MICGEIETWPRSTGKSVRVNLAREPHKNEQMHVEMHNKVRVHVLYRVTLWRQLSRE